MSDDGSNLGMLIAAFDHKAAEIEQQKNQAQLDIQAASQKLEALRHDQAQATNQLATSRQTMAKLPASDAQHPELQNSIQSLEQKQQARAAEISAQAQALQRLNDAQKQEAAQHRLRREQSAFIVQVDAALTRIADGAIRYLFATRALAACEARKITPDIFDDVPSQKIIADVLGKLENAKSRATEAERNDAAIYSKLVAMQSDTGRYLQTFLSRVADNEAKKAQIAAGQNAAEDAISALGRPETPEQKSSRHSHRVIAMVAGVLAGAGAVMALLVSSDFGLPAAAILAVAALGCFWFAWTKTDRYRAQSLGSSQTRLASLKAEADSLNLQTADRDREAQNAVSTFAQQLTQSGISSPPPAGRPAEDIKALNETVQRAINDWSARHSEIRLLGSA
jgi:hypothetical protein